MNNDQLETEHRNTAREPGGTSIWEFASAKATPWLGVAKGCEFPYARPIRNKTLPSE